MTKNIDKIKLTAQRAEISLRELILAGERISQAAVERGASLSNGALNYDNDLYRDLKQRIHLAKQNTKQGGRTSYPNYRELKKQITLKDKYRLERNEIRDTLKKLLGERIELIHHLISLQQYIKHLDGESGKASSVILNIKKHNTIS